MKKTCVLILSLLTAIFTFYKKDSRLKIVRKNSIQKTMLAANERVESGGGGGSSGKCFRFCPPPPHDHNS